MKEFPFLLIILLLTFLSSGIFSCTHDPFLETEEGILPVDSTQVDTIDMPTDSMDTEPGPVDTVDTSNLCDSNTVYFRMQVLPILRSSCAISGCHDAETARDGIILDSYANVMNTGKIKPFDLTGSELYETITEDKPEKRMPPPPNNSLTAGQINVIAKWILQGAVDEECVADTSACNTMDVSYSSFIIPLIKDQCLGCHSGNSPSGGINLGAHADVKAVADNGRLYGAVAWQNGYKTMPQGGDQLPACDLDKIKAWVDAGAPNN